MSGNDSRRAAGSEVGRAVSRYHHSDTNSHTGGHSDHAADLFHFHPYEIAISGYSGAGKTSLAEAIIDYFTQKSRPAYRVGYAKHGSHQPDLVRESRDSSSATSAGATVVHLSSSEQSTWIDNTPGIDTLDGEKHDGEWGHHNSIQNRLLQNRWQGVDFVVAEGLEYAAIPKIVVVDERAEVLNEVAAGKISNVLAYVVNDEYSTARSRCEQLAASPPVSAISKTRLITGSPPVFSASAVSDIANRILELFSEQVRRLPIYGLVLSGGKSTRMKRDKGGIDYHGEPQAVHVYHLLEQFCSKVFVSVRDSSATYGYLPLIEDSFRDIGPVGGILSAMHAYPGTAWLVVGCDMPFLTEETLRDLLSKRDPFKLATAYESSTDGLPEPLCTLYEPTFRSRIHQFLSIGVTCPRKALINSHIRRLSLAYPDALANINTPDEYRAAVERIRSER